MKRFQVHACMRPIIVQEGVYRDLPELMPQYQPSRWKNQKDVARLNARRQGSLLDFIQDFTDAFPKI